MDDSHRTQTQDTPPPAAVQQPPRALSVEPLGDDCYQVTGGAEPHVVTLDRNGLLCNCKSFQFHGPRCKHVAAVEQVLDGAAASNADPIGGTGGPGLETDVPVPEAIEDLDLVDVSQAIPTPSAPSDGNGRLSPPAPPASPVLAGARDRDEERCSDLGNARRLVRLHGADLRYVKTQRRWYAWDDRRWREDATGEAERRAKAIVETLYLEAGVAIDEQRRRALAQHAVRSDSALRVRSMLELASTETEVVLRAEQLDTGAWILNVRNGTLDLRTGELRPHRREDYLTKLAPVRWMPDARAPRWERFLAEITAGDDALAGFLQRAVGYSLTGDTREQCLFFCHGQGANGKSVFLETVQAMLGPDYAQTTPFNTFLSKGGDGPRNDLARLRAVRLVSASEAPGGQPLDEALLKQLVGGDTIAARFLYGEFFQFQPAFKLWLRANHRPPVREQTIAFWRRMRLVPFTVTFPPNKQDRTLATQLREELPGILAWAVRGCAAWQRDGLGEPAIVTRATAAYRAENDTLGEFLEAQCTLDPQAWTSTAELYRAFVSWWEETHGKDRPLTRNWFGRALGERSELLAAERGHMKVRGWCGIRLAGSAASPQEDDGALPF